MSTCQRCGAMFHAVSPAWGDAACGDCIADQIEAGLMLRSLGDRRRPARRAVLTPEAGPAVDGPLPNSLDPAARRHA